MTQDEIELLRDSFADVLRAGDAAAVIFYDRLFDLAPEVRALFKDDLDEQGRLLIAALAQIIVGLSHRHEVLPPLRDLAVRHVGYGVRIEHYAIVGDALIWMIDRVTGPKFTDEIRAAWCAAYALIARTMIEAAYEPDVAARATDRRSAA